MNSKTTQLLELSMALRIILGIAVVAVSGCATVGADREGDAVQGGEVTVMEGDPILIRAVQYGDETVMEHLSAEEVFERGYYAFQARRYEEATENYELILTYFDRTRFYLPSLYNGGLAYERMEQWEEAARLFGLVIDEFPDSDEGLNAHFRLAQVRLELGLYEAIDEQLAELLESRELSFFDRAEAGVLRGRALLEMGAWQPALASFQEVIDANQEQPRRERLDSGHRFIVISHFGMGRANHGLMNEIPLVLPPERMKIDLETKADFHQDAQIAYIRALREHHPKWSVASGYMIGRLYQDFYIDIFVAEIPDDLSEEELAMYFGELRTQTQVLMDKGLRVYERNLSFSRRIARDEQAAQWVEATALHMERMRAFLEDPLVQQRAEQLVVEGEGLDGLWDTSFYARHHVHAAREQALSVVGDPGGEDLEGLDQGAEDRILGGEERSGNPALDKGRSGVDIDVHHPVAVQKRDLLPQ